LDWPARIDRLGSFLSSVALPFASVVLVLLFNGVAAISGVQRLKLLQQGYGGR